MRQSRLPHLRFGAVAALLIAATPLWSPAAKARERLHLQYTSLRLPGAPALAVSADLNQDGYEDLVLGIAYTEWDQIGIEELTEMRQVEGLVMVMTVVPSLMDRREIRVYLGQVGGRYKALEPPLPLDLTILSLDRGPRSAPVLALTDQGISALRLTEGEQGPALSLEPLVTTTPVLARSGALIPDLGLSHDLDGDGQRDLLFPTDAGLEVYPAAQLTAGGQASDRARLAGDTTRGGTGLTRFYPLPVVRDVNGDGLPDLLVPDRRRDWRRFEVHPNTGHGTFGEALSPVDEAAFDSESPAIVHFGDLDGDGVAEYVTEEDLGDPDAGWRKEIKEAKRPPRRYRVFRSRSDLSIASEPFETFEGRGYALDVSDAEFRLPGGFQDLDGDGRQDLITLTLDFSLFQAVRILTTQRLGVGLDFHIFCQDEQGRFRNVEGLDLSGKFKIDLNNLRLGQLSQFAGDFDGDGRKDFLQIGRGRTVTIHRGQPGCRYPTQPDLTLKLSEAPLDLNLVQVRDLNGDRLSDVMVIQPDREPEPGVSASVRLELYLSGGAQ